MFLCYPLDMLAVNSIQERNCRNLQFGYNLPKSIFTDIREIPRLKCACCNRDMFTSEERTHFLQGFLAGSKRALENGMLTDYRETGAFAFLQTLSRVKPKAKIRELIEVPENRDKIRTLSDGVQLGINRIALIADGISVKAPRVVQKLAKYREGFSPLHQEMFEVMEAYAQRYPKKTFAEIFNTPEIAEYHKNIAEGDKKAVLSGRIEVCKRLREFSQTLEPQDAKELLKTNNDAMQVLSMENYYEPQYRGEMVADLYRNFVREANGYVDTGKLADIIKDFPLGGFTPDSMIANFVERKQTDMDLINFFVNDLRATREHFHARSKDGEDVKENTIVLCGKCNYERSNLPYPFFLRFHKEMLTYLPRQINKVITYIRHGKLTGYNDYPVKSKGIILEQSEGLLRPKIGEYLKFRQAQASADVTRTSEIYSRDNARFEEAQRKLDDVDARIEELEARVRALKKEKRGIREEQVNAGIAREVSEKKAKEASERLEIINEQISADRKTNEELKHKPRKL